MVVIIVIVVIFLFVGVALKLRLILIGERFPIISIKVWIFLGTCINIWRRSVTLREIPQKEAKKTISFNFTHLFGEKISKIWKIEKLFEKVSKILWRTNKTRR